MSVLDVWPQRDLSTLADWGALPEDTSRHYELVEGVVVVSPRPWARHQVLARRLATALESALSAQWVVVDNYEVVVDDSPTPTVRAPDIVAAAPVVLEQDQPWAVRADVLAVVEVQSPGTRRTDRIAKVADYAEAGIECYLLEPGPPTVVTELRLRDGAYEEVAEHRDAARITLDGVEVTIDLAGMLDP